MEKKDKVQICKVVAQAILSDGQLTDSELDFLNKLMDRYELEKDQRTEVMERNFGDEPAAMAKEIDVFDTQNELLVELALAVAVDGEIAKQERELLVEVAKVFKVDEPSLDMMIKAAIS